MWASLKISSADPFKNFAKKRSIKRLTLTARVIIRNFEPHKKYDYVVLSPKHNPNFRGDPLSQTKYIRIVKTTDRMIKN